MSAILILVAAVVSALLALGTRHDSFGYGTLWYCLLFAWVTAVAAGILGHVVLPARREA